VTRGDLRLLSRLARSDTIADGPGGIVRRDAIAAVERLATSEDVRDQPLVPPICRGARRAGLWNDLSELARGVLDRVRLEAVARAFHQRRWLTEVLGDLDRRGIACVLLKGAAFHGTLYPDDSPRLGGDIDLLVRTSDFDLAFEVLGGRARPAGPRRDRRTSHAAGYEQQLMTDGPFAVLVELHRALTIPHVFAIDTDELIERSVPHPAYEIGARMLDPEDTLLHLAVHAFRHLRLETHALLDAHEAFTIWRPSPTELERRATAWGAGTALYLLLDAARDLVGTPVSRDLLERLDPGAARERLCRGLYRIATDRRLGLLDRAYRPVQLASLVAVPARRSGVLRYVATYTVQRAGDWLASRRSEA
jgi:hypothetical protein